MNYRFELTTNTTQEQTNCIILGMLSAKLHGCSNNHFKIDIIRGKSDITFQTDFFSRNKKLDYILNNKFDVFFNEFRQKLEKFEFESLFDLDDLVKKIETFSIEAEKQLLDKEIRSDKNNSIIHKI